jgi:ferritin-like metal-binding protein YciE
MTTEPREHLLHWLRDAYAMEKQALEMYEGEAERIEHYPEMKEHIEQHIGETKGQIARLDRCFDILGETPSAVKSTLGWFVGNAQAASGIFVSDEIVKGAMASYVFENLEIASYTILIAAAELDNQHEIAKLCSDNLREEIAMADWLKHRLAPTTQKFLEMDRTQNPARI